MMTYPFENTLNKTLNNVLCITRSSIINGHTQTSNHYRYLFVANAVLALGYITNSQLLPLYAKACDIKESLAALNSYIQKLEKHGFISDERCNFGTDRVLYQITNNGIDELVRLQHLNISADAGTGFGDSYVALSREECVAYRNKLLRISKSPHNHLENQIIFGLLQLDPLYLRGCLKEISMNKIGILSPNQIKNETVFNSDVLSIINQGLLLIEADRNTEGYDILLNKIQYSLNCHMQHLVKTHCPGALFYVVGALQNSNAELCQISQKRLLKILKKMTDKDSAWFHSVFSQGIVFSMLPIHQFRQTIQLSYPHYTGIGHRLVSRVMQYYGINEQPRYHSDCDPLLTDGMGRYSIYLRNHYISGQYNIFIENLADDYGALIRTQNYLKSRAGIIQNTALIILVNDNLTLCNGSPFENIIPNKENNSGSIFELLSSQNYLVQNKIGIPPVIPIRKSDAESGITLNPDHLCNMFSLHNR